MTIKCEGIRKTYYPKKKQSVVALRGISLNIEEGEVYGILGQNGAGKTTLVQILSTQLNHSDGSGSVLGFDIQTQKKEIRKHINVISGGEEGLYPWLSAWQMMEYYGYLYKVPRSKLKKLIENLLNQVGLEPSTWNRPSMTLSKGQKQRILIAKGLINNPSIIFMDEPTIGLDVKAVQETRKMISSWSNNGKTVILTSHNMGDIENTCNRLCIIDNGKVVTEKRLADLREEYRSILDIRLNGTWSIHSKFFGELGKCYEVTEQSNQVSFKSVVSPSKMHNFYSYLSDKPEALVSFDIKNESLEDYYMEQLNMMELS